MNKMKFYFIIFLMLFPVMFTNLPATGLDEASEEFTLNNDNTYRIRLEASQWEYKVYDLNLADANGVNLEFASVAAKQKYEVKHKIILHEKGATIQFNLYSRDVQHGFSINELDIAVALQRPVPGNEFGSNTQVERTLPNEDITYSSFCHIFCGLGHPDMKLKLVVGEGSFEAGPYVFWGALLVNMSIFGLTLRSIVTKVGGLPLEE